MRGRLVGLAAAAAAVFPASAAGAPVLVMDHDGHVVRATDRFLPPSAPTPVPVPAPVRAPELHTEAVVARTPAKKKNPPPPPPTTTALARLYRSGQIDQADYGADSAGFNTALTTLKHLRGARATELGAVIANLNAIAASGQLTPSRLPALFLTLNQNRQWWSTGPMPSTRQYVEFAGSDLVWEYYPGQGIELQVLATFGKADGLYSAGPSSYPQLRQLLAEMIPLAAQRAGGLAWEYCFQFAGGKPPWVSAMTEGTALEALTRAAKAFGPAAGPSPAVTYLQLARQALPIFTVAPPLGVRIPTPVGARYLQYSFAPHTDIINAFLQSLIGLYDFAQFSGSSEAQRLFAAGNAEAEAELPRFDTGAWSLYQPGVEDSLDYHTLVTGFLDQLCARTGAPVYCTTAKHFHAYLHSPPVLQLVTTTASAKTHLALRFRLSKCSRVGVVISRGGHNVFSTSADFPYGTDVFQVPPLPAGSYEVTLTATDLAGNFARTVGSLQVFRTRRSP